MSEPMRPVWTASLLLLLMAPIGFALGTAVLLGPVRWTTAALRSRRAPASVESLAVIAMIVALVIVTAAIAWVLLGVMTRGGRVARFAIPIAALAVAGGAWAMWLDTNLMSSIGGGGDATEVAAGFTFGPYPDLATLARLKTEGYTGVISLLHPAVVPFEPQLLARERRETEAAGMPLIHLPMLPWISGNDESVEKLAALARAGDGKYYVHCYLGKDRVLIARRVVEQHAKVHVAIDGISEKRSIDERTRFERGSLVRLSDQVTLGPYPTDEEFGSFVANGTFDHVVTLLDPTDPGDLRRIEDERRWLSSVDVNLVELPLVPATPERASEVVREVRALEGRVYVHAFFSTDRETHAVPRLFVDAFGSGQPPAAQGD